MDKVPVQVQSRLKTVLAHLSATKQTETCPDAIGPHSCAGIPGDIEDLGKRRHSADALDEDEKKLFDSARFTETQKPLLEASTLPGEVYSSHKWFSREMEKVFMPAWMIVGREDEVAESGSYLAVDTEWGGPVVVCRGTDNKLYAFANVCRHRGAKVVPDGKGKASKIGLICPYHAWTYGFDGKLKFAPGIEETKEFDEDSVSLDPVQLDTFCGFIFVCHTGGAKPVAESLGDLPEKLPAWFGTEGKLKDMVCVQRKEYDVACNWKFLMENTCETYHTAVVHKGSLGPMKAWPMEPHRGQWDAVRVPTKRTVVPLPTDFVGEEFPLPAFTDQTAFVNVFPSLQFNVTHDCMWFMHLIPTGPMTTHIKMGFVFPPETAKLDYFPQKLEQYLKRWHIAVQEDNAISLNQQRGVRSTFRRPGRFTKLEFGTHNFDNWLLSKMLDGQESSYDPGQRTHFKSDEVYSNDSEQMTMLAAESEKIQKTAAL